MGRFQSHMAVDPALKICWKPLVFGGGEARGVTVDTSTAERCLMVFCVLSLCVYVSVLQDFARDVMKIDAIPSKKLDTIKVR